MEINVTVTLIQLFTAYLACEDYASRVGMLNQQEVAACGMIYEELKQRTSDGDYLRFVEWRTENEPILREYIGK